jgi:hypothetical protein
VFGSIAKRFFDPSRPVFARTALIVEGLTYGVAEEIPWKELGVQQSDVEMWFRNRAISHFRDGDNSPEAVAFYSGAVKPVDEKPKGKSRKRE